VRAADVVEDILDRLHVGDGVVEFGEGGGGGWVWESMRRENRFDREDRFSELILV